MTLQPWAAILQRVAGNAVPAARVGAKNGVEGELAIVCLCEGAITLPEFVRIALGLIPGDPIQMDQDEDQIVLRRATPPHEARARHRSRPAPVIALPRPLPAD